MIKPPKPLTLGQIKKLCELAVKRAPKGSTRTVVVLYERASYSKQQAREVRVGLVDGKLCRTASVWADINYPLTRDPQLYATRAEAKLAAMVHHLNSLRRDLERFRAAVGKANRAHRQWEAKVKVAQDDLERAKKTNRRIR